MVSNATFQRLKSDMPSRPKPINLELVIKWIQAQYSMPLVTASRRLKQEEREVEATLGYIVRLCKLRKFKQHKKVQNIGYPIPKEPV